jgi:hypothetical protein
LGAAQQIGIGWYFPPFTEHELEAHCNRGAWTTRISG